MCINSGIEDASDNFWLWNYVLPFHCRCPCVILISRPLFNMYSPHTSGSFP